MSVAGIPILAVAQRDKLRQVVIQRSQSVMHPRAERRIFAVEHVATGMKLRLRSVIVVGRVHRSNHCNIINAVSNMGHPVAQFDPAVAKFAEADLQRIEPVTLLSVGVVDDGHSRQFQFLRILSVLVGGLVNRLTGVLRQFRLWVKAFHVRHAAVHEQPDDALRLRSKVRLPFGGLPFGRRVRSNNSILCQHGSQGQASESHPHIRQERAAMDATTFEIRFTDHVVRLF